MVNNERSDRRVWRYAAGDNGNRSSYGSLCDGCVGNICHNSIGIHTDNLLVLAEASKGEKGELCESGSVIMESC